MSKILTILIVAIISVAFVVHAGSVLFTGTSYPPVPMKKEAVYYKRVPASSPILP